MPRIIIADYSPEWPARYERTKAFIAPALAPLEPYFEHVGSTSVPGLAAKPIVDVMIGVREGDLNRVVEPLSALGYEYVPEFEAEMPYRRYFRGYENGVRVEHLHVVPLGHEFWVRHLLFRDYLRAHAEAAREYEAVKRELASRIESGQEYTEAKTPFITSIEDRAWREQHGEDANPWWR